MIKAILSAYPPAVIASCDDSAAQLSVLLPYTERHFARIERLVEEAHLLDFTLDRMEVLESGEDRRLQEKAFALDDDEEDEEEEDEEDEDDQDEDEDEDEDAGSEEEGASFAPFKALVASLQARAASIKQRASAVGNDKEQMEEEVESDEDVDSDEEEEATADWDEVAKRVLLDYSADDGEDSAEKEEGERGEGGQEEAGLREFGEGKEEEEEEKEDDEEHEEGGEEDEDEDENDEEEKNNATGEANLPARRSPRKGSKDEKGQALRRSPRKSSKERQVLRRSTRKIKMKV